MKSFSYIITIYLTLFSSNLSAQQIMVEHVGLSVYTDTVMGSPNHRIGTMLRYRSTANHPNPGYITLYHYKKDSTGFSFVQTISLTTIAETDIYCFHRNDYHWMTCGANVQLDSGYHRFVFSSEHIDWISPSTVLPYKGVAWIDFETTPRIGTPKLSSSQCHKNEINTNDTLRYDTIARNYSYPLKYRGPFHYSMHGVFNGNFFPDPMVRIDSMTVSVSNNLFSFDSISGDLFVDTTMTNGFTHQTYTHNGLYDFEFIPTGPGIYPNTFTFSGHLDGKKIWTSTSQFSFHVGDFIGLPEPKIKSQLKVYPNPASGRITIEHPSPENTAEMFCVNSSGQEVFRRILMPFEESIQIELKKPGLYVLVYISENLQLSEQIVIE